MTRGTTPTITIKLKSDIDLTELKSVYVTFQQGQKLLTKAKGESGVEVGANSVSIFLTQEETLFFSTGTADIQLRGLTEDDEAFATTICKVNVNRVLLSEVIE